MTIDIENLLNSIMESMDRVSFIKSESIPDINLYMDQVTTFMDENLKNTARHKGEDKILTKTMINNYAKNNLLPPPDKKKYSKEHIMILVFIYYYKNIISISDIQNLLNPLTEKYFGKDSGITVQSIYDEVTNIAPEQVERMKQDITSKYKTASEQFMDVPNQDREFLQMFSFICILGFDVYMKKLLIEKVLDGYMEKVTNEKIAEQAMEKSNAEKLKKAQKAQKVQQKKQQKESL